MVTRIEKTEDGKDTTETNLSDCELLLRKYTDGSWAQLETLFILAEIFDRHDNNASKLTLIF